MNQKNRRDRFPIEKKLAAIERNLKLLNTSITITHTPLRTLKSMVKANMVLPTRRILEKDLKERILQAIDEIPTLI